MSNSIKHIHKFLQYLCPAGNGVHTVNTGKERKAKIQKALYHSSQESEIFKNWSEYITNYQDTTKPCLIGVTSDNGGGILRGCNWGPLYLREAFSPLSQKYYDLGDIRTIPHLLHDKYLNHQTLTSCRQALYNDQNSKLPVSPLSILEDFSHHFFTHSNHSLISLGGDHSISYPLAREWIKAKNQQKTKVAIIHFDAHTDLLDTRLGVDICFASWAYHCLELLEKPSHLVQLGIRSSGKDKKFWEKTLGVKQFWANEISPQTNQKIIQNIITDLKKDHIQELYISFDIDVLSSEYASATGTPEPHGLSPKLAIEIITALSKHFKIHSADLVEVSPFLKTQASSLPPEPETTLNSAKMIFETLIKSIT